MNGPSAGSSRPRRWQAVACVVCALALWGTAGAAWRTWRFEQRGIERGRGTVGARFSRPHPRAGINVELAQYDTAELHRALVDLSSMDVHWLRQRFPWRAIEPEPGLYEWGRWDVIVEAVHHQGLGLIAVLDTPPDWALPGERLPLPCDTVCNADAYARFVGAFAERYGTTIDHYQVWDEPNLAASHLRRALNDISKAATHLEKADVGKSEAGAVDALNRGYKELDEAATDLDNGKIDSAQRHYDKASESFDKASAILS